MLIADSQVHIWAASTPERPWPKRPAIPHKPAPYSAGELIKDMDEAGVDRVVIVPPSWEGDYNDLALAAAKKHPTRFAVMGRFDPEQPVGYGHRPASACNLTRVSLESRQSFSRPFAFETLRKNPDVIPN